MIADYRLSNGEWNCQTLPSTIILATREKQLDDKEGIETLLDKASNVVEKIDDEKIKELMQKAFDELFARYQGKGVISSVHKGTTANFDAQDG